jgi:uncharacterized repeat protein (TIGR01451 family)
MKKNSKIIKAVFINCLLLLSVFSVVSAEDYDVDVYDGIEYEIEIPEIHELPQIICPDNEFSKKVWDDNTQSWDETTSHNIGDIIKFRLIFTAEKTTSDVKIIDYLPNTVAFINSSSAPSLVSYNQYFDLGNGILGPCTKIEWNIGDMGVGQSIEIIIHGEIIDHYNKYYESEYNLYEPRGITNPEAVSSTRNVAVLTGTRYQSGCGNPYPFTKTNDAFFTIILPSADIEVNKYVRDLSCSSYQSYSRDCCLYYDSVIVDKGDSVRFKIEVKNTGDVPLNITVFDSLPQGLIYNNNATPFEPETIVLSYVNDGHIMYVWHIGIVNPNDTAVITFDAIVDGFGVYENSASAVGAAQSEIVGDEDIATVIVPCAPGVEIEKWVWNGTAWSDYADVNLGDNVRFKAVIYNPSECYLMHFCGNVFDQLPSNLRYVNGSSTIYESMGWPNMEVVDWENNTVTWYKPPTIMPGENLTFYYNATAVDCGLGINNLTAHPEGFDPVDYPGGESVSNIDGSYDVSANATVNVICELERGIDLVKTNDICECVDLGGIITYTYRVTNIGDVTLYNVSVVDDVLGVIGLNSTVLAPGEWAVGIVQHQVTESDLPGPIENVANASGEDQFGIVVYDDDTNSIVICEPCPVIDIDVKKIVKWNCQDPTYNDTTYAHVNEWVTFKITVNNTGDVPINITICDILPPGLVYNGYPRVNGAEVHPDGMCWTINNVQTGGTVIVTFRAMVMVCGEHINTAVVTAVYDGYEPVVKQDNATVIALCPDIEIVKSADSNLVCNGSEVTYTYTVTNTGNHHLINVTVTDDKITGVSYVSGDTNIDGWLDLDETWIYNATSILCENTTNTATVSAKDELGRIVTDYDTEFVEVIECQEPPELGIEVNKTVKRNCCGDFGEIAYVHQNDWVTFNITVTNTGDAPLNVTVTDILPWGLDYDNHATPNGPDLVIVSVGVPYPDTIYVWNLGFVDPGETFIITFRATVNGQVCGGLINNVYVSGTYEDYPEVTDEDSAEVFVLCPGISIVKSADKTFISPGELVTYTYEVNNTGNAALRNVVVVDDKLGVVSYVSGDTNMDGWLNLDETWIFTASTQLYESTTNNATVTAEDELGLQVSNYDDAYVEVHECGCTPSISIDKKVFDGEVWVDDDLVVEKFTANVEFKIIINNTGTCDLTNIVVIDTMNCGLDSATDFSVTPNTINDEQITWLIQDDLLPSQTISITFNATAHMNTSNEVNVTANSTYDQTPVSANDEVTITKGETIPDDPVLAYTPESYDFGEKLKNKTVSTTIDIWNSGTGILSYELTKDCSWLELSETSGTSEGEHNIVTVTANTTGLQVGEYSCNISITSNAGNAKITVTITVVEEQPVPPTVTISKPIAGKMYFRDKELFKLANTLLIGPITIIAEAESVDATITKMEVYIDDAMKFNDTNSSISFYFNEVIFGRHTIKVKAYDSNGLSAQEEISILIFNFGRA